MEFIPALIIFGAAGFVGGLLLGCSTKRIAKQKKPHQFRQHQYRGTMVDEDADLKKRQEDMTDEEKKYLLNEDMEFYSNKEFK